MALYIGDGGSFYVLNIDQEPILQHFHGTFTVLVRCYHTQSFFGAAWDASN